MIWNRKVAIGVGVVLVIGFLIYGFWPSATPVTVEEVTRDSLRVTVEEQGRTQLRERYVVSAPATAYLKRVSGAAADPISEGEVLARLATRPSNVLDASGYQAAEAQVESAQAAVQRARAEAKGAETALAYAKEEHRRLQRLHEQGTASQQQLDQARVEFEQAQAKHQAARQAVAQARGELRAARSRLATDAPNPERLPVRMSVRAPVDGQILQVHQQSATVVQAGTPLFTVGHPDSLEVSVSVLSSDAVRITEGTPVELIRWGENSSSPLSGRVRVVPPKGETDVSALGVEEQRVEVLVDPTESTPQWQRLGTGYRVVARFVIWAGEDVLQVPQSALFRRDGGWAVFEMQDGTARRQPVDVGHRSGLRAEITDGLARGDRVITHPGNELSDGMRVEAR